MPNLSFQRRNSHEQKITSEEKAHLAIEKEIQRIFRRQPPPRRKPKNFKETVSRFVPLLKPFIPGMVVVLIAGVIGTVLTVTGPMFLGDIVDAIKEQADIKLSGGEINFQRYRKSC